MRTNTFKIVLAFGIIVLCVFNILGQESYIKDRWNFKIGYIPIKITPKFMFDSEKNFFTTHFHSLHLEANYGFFNTIEGGPYVGYCFIEADNIEIDDGGYTLIGLTGNVLYYGINANFEIFPLFIKKDDFRFDLYVTTKIGAVSYLTPKDCIPTKGTYFDYNVGGGLCFYPFSHLGIFSEFLVGSKVKDYTDAKNTRWNFGLTRKF